MTQKNGAIGASSVVPSRHGFALLTLMLTTASVVPALIQRVAGGVRPQTIGGESVMPLAGSIVQYSVAGIVLLYAVYMCGRYGPTAMGDYDASSLIALLVLWLYFVVSGLLHGSSLFAYAVLFPASAIIAWIAKPEFAEAAILAHVAFAVSLLSLLLGTLVPAVGLYSDQTGQQAISEKGLLFESQLVGPFGSTSNLGQFVALCFPFLFLLRRLAVRYMYGIVMFLAVVWSGSRSSLIAVGVVLAIGICCCLVSLKLSYIMLNVGFTCSIVAAVCIFLVPWQNLQQFSGRAAIWSVSLDALGRSPLFGLGADWFIRTALLRTAIGSRSEFLLFHGHNQILQLLVTGGVVGLLLFLIVVRYAHRGAVTGFAEKWVGILYLIAFFVSGSQELNLGIVDRYQFYAVALMPLLLLLFSRSSRNVVESREDFHARG